MSNAPDTSTADPAGAMFLNDEYGMAESATSSASYAYINESGLPDELVAEQLRTNRDIASVIERWSQSLTAAPDGPSYDLFNRQRTGGSRHVHAQMARCAWAVENDDILTTLADVVEGLAFQKCRFECFDADQQDFWNQWAATVNLDARLREMFRELFKVSQVYVGLWWERRAYAVRDSAIAETIEDFERTKAARLRAAQQALGAPVAPVPASDNRGNRRRKKRFEVQVPTAFTIFDPTKILPVGSLMFGRERFAYIADRAESAGFAAAMAGQVVDATVLGLIESHYRPTGADVAACKEVGADPERLWLLREGAVFRHSLTRAAYERHAPVRLKSVLPLLEMKEHLRNADRATLIGQTNFIIVITKGTDKLPAKNSEIENLREQSRVIARLPVLVGDHRLHVEIVSPATDNTLIESRYQVMDSRLVFTALGSFHPIVQGGSSNTGVSEMSRVVARGIESRRHMLVRALEAHVFAAILEHNAAVLAESPSLAFTPKRVTLDFNADVLGQILKLRDRGDISRETMLEEMDYDQDVEVLRRARERASYDGVFESQTPYSSPATNPYASPGASPGAPLSNVGPAGQPRTEGGRPPGTPNEVP